MSDEQPSEGKAPAPPAAKKPAAKKEEPHTHVVIRARPKVIFLWPFLVASIVAGVWTLVEMNGGKALVDVSLAPGRIFVWTFVVNLLALGFDFTRGEFVAVVLAFGVATLSILLLDQNLDVSIVKTIGGFLDQVEVRAHPHLYFMFSLVLGFVLMGVWVQGFFDYWEITHNEVLHHKGFLGDLKRYPAPNLQLHKEITDLFEYCLFFPFGGAGRIVLMPHGAQRSVVLDNVIGVNIIEERTQKMLSSLQVKIDTGTGHSD